MKKIFFIIAILSLGFNPLFAQVGIGTPTPNANAELDVVSTTQGVLFPRLDDTQAGTLAGNLTTADNGMIIYNTTDECLQVFVAPNFECIVVRSGDDVGGAGSVKVNVRDGSNQTARVASGFDGGTQNTAHPGYFLTPSETTVQLDFDVDELVLSESPTTNWPENSDPADREIPNATVGGGAQSPGPAIFIPNTSFTNGETGDAWLENDTFGQIHFWRIIIYVDASGHNQLNEANLQLTLRNPQSAFSTSSTRFVPTAPGIFELSYVLSTIADDFSLPSGTGNGYVFEVVSTNPAIGEIWVDSVTRISIFAD